MSTSKSGAYGWSPVPRSLDKFLASTSSSNSQPISTATIPHPSDPISKKTLEHVTDKLPKQTLNHSLRVYDYGYAILSQHFPQYLSEESHPHFLQTFYLTCLLHDIGTAEENLGADKTKMSFDFYGAIVAMDVLREFGAEKDLAEAVGEAIIRHQDLGTTGEITAVGGLVQVVTILDNAGLNSHLVHLETIEYVTNALPRNKWTSCFAATVRKEIGLKPWAHSTHIDGFAELVEANKVMEPYDS